MTMIQTFLKELQQEAVTTRKMLERVPIDKADWKPHVKSMSIGRLATHVAEIPHWVSNILLLDEYDFMKHPYNPYIAKSSEELLEIHQTNIDNAVAELGKVDDEYLSKKWIVRRGDFVVADMKKKIALRSWGCNHLYHHRGQLSVFLRLLDIPVPGMYGPSADER